MTQIKTLRFVIGIAAVLLLLGVVMAGAVSADESSAVGDSSTVVTDNGGATVTNEKSLKNAVAAGGYVRLGATISMSSQLDIKNKVVIDLDGHELRFRGKWHIYVVPGGDLTINDSSNPSTGKIMGGKSNGNGGCIYVGGGGKLTLNNGTIRDGVAKNHGGGVYVDNGTFIMNGGNIYNNFTGLGGIGGDDGAGVYMNGGTFDMYGGSIEDNRANHYGGGVYLNNGAKFTMYDGTMICDNYTEHDNGGGVCVNNGSTFTMKGGTIDNNLTARSGQHILIDTHGYGGGVYVINGSTFTMDGGVISNNYSPNNGGGVFVKNSEFTMSDKCTISENSVIGYGGGVCVDTGARFTMNGGSISDNLCSQDDGGGVCVLKGGKFIMTDGTIEKNNARGDNDYYSYGGGVYVQGGEFEMSGGIIQENTVENDGGGVFVCEEGTMSVSGDAKITGNTLRKKVSNVGLDSGGTLILNGNLTGEIHIYSPNPQEGAEFGTATSKASGAENILSEDGKLCGKINGGRLVWTTVNEGGSSSLSGALTDKTTTTAAKSPVPVLGILAGLGAAVMLLRRK